MTIDQWAARWNVPYAAVQELLAVPHPKVPAGTQASETNVQSRVRLEAARLNIRMWRNNVGALIDARGVPVRYGLANDSKAVNAVIKSADLIGIRPTLITPDHVGSILGQFVSRECKRSAWRYVPGDERDEAQLRWATLVNACGGDAKIVSDVGSF